ncbi:MAG: D-alanyl-D-alanine carboxypeptidase, partial [Hassallia sp.]
MNNPGFSEKPQNSSVESGEEIPPALRDTPEATPKKVPRLQPMVLAIGGVVVFIMLAVISGFLFFLTAPKKTANQPSPTSSIPANAQTGTSVNPPDNADTVLGHLTYSEAPESELAAISRDGRIKMRKAAAEKYQAMIQAARSAGVILVPISGFRS